MFTLLEYTPEQAAQVADQIMKFETRLAKVTFTRLEQRNPYLTYKIINALNYLR
ncbi:MAG TPA: hypothetical protein PKM28_00930 [Tenuifilaceae bacterium]|nr:hypothetical protein [Tenuifilaceae bacterium]